MKTMQCDIVVIGGGHAPGTGAVYRLRSSCTLTKTSDFWVCCKSFFAAHPFFLVFSGKSG